MPYQFNIDLLGDSGIARNARVFVEGDTNRTEFRMLKEVGPASAKATGLPYRGLIRHFLDCIESGIEPDVSVEHAVKVHEVCFAALLSERTGHAVALPLKKEDQKAIHDLVLDKTNGS